MAAVAFVALVGAAGFRATPTVFFGPLHAEFGWPTSLIASAVSINLALYGLTAPFAAALMERFGMRRVVAGALVLVAAGSGLTVFMTASWQLVLCWGVLIGLATGSMALAFVATVTNRWFVHRRGVVTGVLTAGGSTGQVIFLPLLAALVDTSGWRAAALTVAGAALVVVPLVVWLLRDHPSDVGLRPYGAPEEPAVAAPPSAPANNAARRALTVLGQAARTRAFWLLAASFAICGMSTNGLVQTHFIPAAHDHGMPETTASGLLALVGIFDIAGTVLSGWLTDRFSSRWLLVWYYTLRGGSLLLLPHLFAPTAEPGIWVFIIFYGLDWVATVPPTVALCRQAFGEAAPIVFGWVFAAHQLGAGIAAVGAGVIRDHFGEYTLAWSAAGALCAVAAVCCAGVRPRRPAPVPPEPAVAGG
ncbi:MFS transporter [Goodfellowiella coeruleoviolacea]|uniref:MFS transporter n=1 Tax=Goodfellowiella coeruleoviolacea TaxID=334858 RepID=UPI0038995630